MKSAIVCVDDERIIIMSVIEQLMEHFGNQYLYEMATSGEEALEIVDELISIKTNVILIISDWLMNGMKGDELLIEVHKKYPNVKTLMLTGQADPAAVSHAVDIGALNAFVPKPWNKEVLIGKIDELINR